MKRIIEKLIEGVKSPRQGLVLLIRNTFPQIVSDEGWIQYVASLRFGRKFDLITPKTFNEKLNWMKLHDRNPRYTLMADKYRVKDYVKERIGENYVVPCYGVWSHFDEINFNNLPQQFVLKCTHDSSGVIICRDKDTFDYANAKRHFNRYLKKNCFWNIREWVYKNIPPRIIAEKYLDEGTGHELQDYKFWCFNGVPTYMYITNKGKIIKENFYDMDFNPVDINHGFERTKPEFSKPDNFEEMKKLAAKLSEEIPFVRIDFFNVKGKLYFGECTFYDWGGIRPFKSYEMDLEIGKFLELPNL